MANERKSEQLGMPYGTACYKLRKQIMFKMAQRLGEDACFHCAETINTISEFSIEHKQPWQNVAATLFWDLDNIAFSHLRCNVEAGNNPPPPPGSHTGTEYRKIGPTGTAWCRKHQEFIPVARFSKNRHRWNKLSDACRECRSSERPSKRSVKLNGLSATDA